MCSARRNPHNSELSSAASLAISHVTSLVAPGALPLPHRLHLTAHFHPDRTHPDTGELMLASAANSGSYVSQFVTGTSNGGLTAHPGGDRFLWEQRVFGGAYDHALAMERPIYAALNHRRREVGAAPRFGSCHLRFHPQVAARATFCYPDSHAQPRDFGVAQAMPLIEVANAHDSPLAHTDPDHPDSPDLLNDYIEAQVHGSVLLSGDVEALVLDPSYRGTLIEEVAGELPCPVEWHVGFAVHIDRLTPHQGYRGPEPLELAKTIANNHTADGVLTPRAIGDAARLHTYHPQHVKQVWHLLARFGWDWSGASGL